MPLVEIIKGANTSDETLARGLISYCKSKKTPIVVNDGSGFFTSRVFGTFTNEGITLLGEGVAAPMIETEARKAGMPIGPLAISDEFPQPDEPYPPADSQGSACTEGKALPEHPAFAVIDLLLNEYKRPSRRRAVVSTSTPMVARNTCGQNSRCALKSRANRFAPRTCTRPPAVYPGHRNGAVCGGGRADVRCRANIGSIFGIGFAAWTGGALQFINQYGLNDFVARARYLAEQYGERFSPPALLLEKAAQGTTF